MKAYSSEKNRIPLPDHCKLQVGDDVAIYHHNSVVADGIVYKKTNDKLKVSLRNTDDEAMDL